MTEELKQKMKEGREKKKLERVATESAPQDLREDLETFKKESAKKTEQIFGLLEQLLNKDKKIGQSLEVDPLLMDDPKVAVEDEIQELSGKQLLVFQKYFAAEDGFKAWYNVNENIFTIEVPMTLSNTTEAHRVLYKQDLRSRKVDQNNVLASMDQWCRLVAQNLKYNKLIKLK
jgi:hypothetical protein